MGIYGDVLPSSKSIIWSYLEFYGSMLASLLKKILISSLYISGKPESIEVKVTITW
jgi:hypothetical protein